ncbi:MAG: hypothetical protein H7832_11135 [Magnetococcus sp. DMHC-6]
MAGVVFITAFAKPGGNCLGVPFFAVVTDVVGRMDDNMGIFHLFFNRNVKELSIIVEFYSNKSNLMKDGFYGSFEKIILAFMLHYFSVLLKNSHCFDMFVFCIQLTLFEPL